MADATSPTTSSAVHSDADDRHLHRWRSYINRRTTGTSADALYTDDDENDDALNDIDSHDASAVPLHDVTPQYNSGHAAVACRPRHVHLSVGRNQNTTHTSMTVSFSVRSRCSRHYADSAIGAVRVGGDAQQMSTLVFGNVDDVRSYNATLSAKKLKHAKQGITHYFSDVHFHIEIDGLRSGSRYYYECLYLQEGRQNLRRVQTHNASNQYLRHGDDVQVKIIAQSDHSTFITPPSPGQWYAPPLDRTVKFAVLGDLATRSHSRETVSKLEQNRLSSEDNTTDYRLHHGQGIDCILLAGDIAYANADHEVWDSWMDMMSDYDFFKMIPVQIAIGNHDIDYDSTTLEIGVAYENRFRMPQVQPAIRSLAPNDLFHHGDKKQVKDFLPYQYGNAFYSFTFGPSKHIVLSSYSSFLPGSVQYEWLLSELKSTDRSITPWLIVMLHCPIYTTFDHHHDEIFITEARVHLEPIFVEYVVNFVISGHIHSYMRTVPTANSTAHPRGPIYIIQGNGGRQANEPFMNEVPEEWVKVRDHSMYGYGTLELFNITHAKWRWVKTGYNNANDKGYQPEFGINDNVWISNQLYVANDEYLEGESVSS